MGDYIPAKLGFDDGESIIFMAVTEDYSETLVTFYRNGKCAKVPLSSYETKTKRRKLSGAYSDLSELVGMFLIKQDSDFVLRSTAERRWRSTPRWCSEGSARHPGRAGNAPYKGGACWGLSRGTERR